MNEWGYWWCGFCVGMGTCSVIMDWLYRRFR